MSGYDIFMTRSAPLVAALGLAAVLAVVASSASRPPITQAASGKTFHLAKGGSATLRLSNRWRWSEPKASTRAVVLTPVEYFVDPGFREWTIDARRAGSATIQSVGKPNCSTCALVTRSFRVKVVVAAG
jgi:hypothetical protein